MQRVLIIENHANIRELLVVAFKREGYETCTGTGWKDVESFLRDTYDLVVADLEQDPSAGLEILKAIKLNNPDTEVVAALPRDFNVGDIISSGFYDYVRKPFLLTDVVDIGKKALEKKQLADKVRNLEQIRDMDKFAMS